MKNYEELYKALVFELERAKDEAVVLYKDYKEAGLTFNAIEAEGYLRGTLRCFNTVKYVEDMFSYE